MNNLIRLTRTRTVWLAASALAVSIAFTGTTAIAGGPRNAAPALEAPGLRVDAKLKQPKLKHGELRVRGTNASDKIALRLRAGEPTVLEIDVRDDGAAEFSFERADVAELTVNAGPGDDVVRIDESNGVFTDGIPTTIDGRSGDDRLVGGRGNETLLGGPGDDSIDGNGGNDVAFMDSGDDAFVWDPGDGSDVVEGQAGADAMLFNGAGAAEQVDLSANGDRLRFFRAQGAVTMDTAGVERIDFNALGGADLVTVNDLGGTGVSDVRVDLAATLGGATGDGQADRVVVGATAGDDTIDISGDAGGVKVSGLSATVAVLHPEGANDRLEINTLAGNDAVDTGGLAAGAIQLLVDGIPVP